MTDQTHSEQTTDEQSNDQPETVTIELELDPARSFMWREAKEAGGPVAEGFLHEQIQNTVQRAYDNRHELRAAFQEQSGPSPQGPVEQGPPRSAVPDPSASSDAVEGERGPSYGQGGPASQD